MPGGGARPRLRRAGMLAVPAGLVLLAIPAAAPAQAAAQPAAGTPPSSDFQVLTTAAALSLTATQNPPNFGPFANGIVNATLGYSAGDFASGGDSSGQAAAFYPGDLVAQGPALFCSQVVPDVPGAACPKQVSSFSYPLLARASYPTAPHSTAPAGTRPIGGGPVPLTVVPAPAAASAGAAGASSATSLARAAGLSGTPVAVTIGSAASSEAISGTGDTALARVTTELSDVTIGGVLHIRSLRSVDTVTVHTVGPVSDAPQTTLTGVTLAGRSATIDSSGVHVAGRDGPALVRRLTAQGLTVALVGTTRQDTPGVARSTATALEVDFTRPVNTGQQPPQPPQPVPSVCANDLSFPCGVPDPNATYSGRLLLGEVGVAASAEPGIDLSFNFPLPQPPVAAGGGTGGAPVLAGANPAPPAGPSLAEAPATGGPPALASAGRGGPAGVLAALSRHLLGEIYAALALGAAALFAGWRATMAVATRRGR